MRLRTTALPTFLVHGKADAGGILVAALQHFQQESRPRRFSPRRTARNSARLRSSPGAGCRACRYPATNGAFVQAESRLRPRLRRAATTPRPPLGGHAGTETVPALADEFGRLIGTLHLF